MGEAKRILIVEDDERLAALLADYLRAHGFDVGHEPDGARATKRVESERPDLVVLDLMLPGEDGLSICRALRPRHTGPILILTARAEDADQVAGLEIGADDYVVKPVPPRVLLARIRALLRRRETGAAEPRELRIGSLHIDVATREVSRDGRAIELTTAEFDLLWALAKRAGQILGREELLAELRGIGYDGLDRSIDVRVSKLRHKLGDDPRQPALIKTVRGAGYLLVVRVP